MELKYYAIDPMSIHTTFIDAVKDTSGIAIEDPTNAFTMLMEGSSTLVADALHQMTINERKIYPSLARDMEDLYHHINGVDERDFFASPARTKVRIYVNVNDIVARGVQGDGGRYITTIPANTRIVVDNIPLSITDPIKVTLVEREHAYHSYVEKLTDDGSVDFKDIGAILSTIYTDKDGNNWVVFEVPVVQAVTEIYETTVTKGQPFKHSIPIEGSYYYSKVEHKSPATGGEWKEIPKIFSLTVFDANALSIYTKVTDDAVVYEIPDIYIDKNDISGSVRFTIHTTRGKVRSFLNKYGINDFTITLPKIVTTEEEASAKNIDIVVEGPYVLDGGNNRRTLKDVRAKIVHRSYGYQSLPITERQLRERAKLSGFTIYRTRETFTGRSFIATKDISDTPLSKELSTVTNIYNKSVTMDFYDNQSTYNGVYITDESIIVDADTVFISENGVVRPIDDATKAMLDSSSLSDLYEYLSNTHLTYTPFRYIIDHGIETLQSRVYDVNHPEVTDLSILSKNIDIDVNCNITDIDVYPTDSGYELYLTVLGNQKYSDIKDTVAIQLRIPTRNGMLYYHAVPDVQKTLERYGEDVDTKYYCKVDASKHISSDHHFAVTNGWGVEAYKEIPIHGDIECIIYTTGQSIITPNTPASARNYIDNENDIKGVPNTGIIGITKEKCRYTFATSLEYIWRETRSMYTSHRYKTHTEDVPLLYTEDVYDVNPETGCVYTVSDTDNDGVCDTIEKNIIHHAGDPVLDANGNPIYKYRAGDIVLDQNGDPIIDNIYGVLRMADVITLDYAYKRIGKYVYLQHLDDTIMLIKTWANDHLTELNRYTLDNTRIIYRPRRNEDKVITRTGEEYDYTISPKVNLYFNSEEVSNTLDISELEIKIGEILNLNLSRQYIDMRDIVKEIEAIGDSGLVGVKVEGVAEGNPNILNLDYLSNRFMLDKYIDRNFNVRYKIDVQITMI